MTVRAFHSIFQMEAYIFEKGDGEDGFLNHIRQFCADDLESEVLTELGINNLVPRRMPNTNNVAMNGTRGYWRQIIIRYLDGEPSTPQTRQHGLAELKAFLLDPANTRYPPADIETEDVTDPENPQPLDHFFMDENIKEFMEEDIESHQLNPSFVTNFPEVARLCWAHHHVSEWARTLGFPIQANA